MTKKIIFSLIFFSCCLINVPTLQATSIAPENVNINSSITTPSNTSLPDLTEYQKTYYWGGETLNANGHFANDVIATGNNITIDGIIEGDVLAAGANITINGVVNGNIRAAGGNIIINAQVKKNVTVAGGNIQISSQAIINKDLNAYGGTIDIAGLISGDATIEAGQLNFGEKSIISGNLNYSAQTNETSLQNKVMGEIVKEQNEVKEEKENGIFSEYTHVSYWLWFMMKLIWLLIVGVIVVAIGKNYLEKITEKMYKSIGVNILWGLLITIISPLAIILVCLTIIGIPVGVLGLVFYILAMYLSSIVVGVAIGKKILPNSKSLFSPMILGILVFQFVDAIPLFGGIITFIGTCWALGALLNKKTNE